MTDKNEMQPNTSLGSVEITKEHFIEIVEQIEKQYNYDVDYCDKLGALFHPYIEPYKNHLISNALFK